MKGLTRSVMKQEGILEEKLVKEQYKSFRLKAFEDITLQLLQYNVKFEDFLKDLSEINGRFEEQFEK